ncbi:hypothetical protein WJX72_003433 [[Myrmecia] bisecta]|uniref:Prefoldin subunit 3 n=1 Tax=[Myrmecia] bisecta TaxID=41462 RepID=A0AAW1QEN3_9CHLO
MAESSTDQQVIPAAQFIDNVEDFLAGRPADAVIEELNGSYRLYKAAEQRLVQHRTRLLGKLPEIRKALTAVHLLVAKRDEEVEVLFDFQLSDQVYAKAVVKDVQTVNLWLGANVMLEYPLDEAVVLLMENLKQCEQNLETAKRDIATIKDFVTTTEVSMARIYNYDVQKRKGSRAKDS